MKSHDIRQADRKRLAALIDFAVGSEDDPMILPSSSDAKEVSAESDDSVSSSGPELGEEGAEDASSPDAGGQGER